MGKAKRARPEPKATNIIFSYVPLLMGKAGVYFMGDEAVEAAKEVTEHMDELPSGNAKACMWTMDEDGVPGVVYLIEEADAIADHLKQWAEGKPGDWFSFHHLEKGQAYATALMPNFQKSAERWKMAFQLRYGFPPVEGGGESHIFRPLHSVAPTKAAYSQVKPYLKDKIRVGLVDASEINERNWMVEKEKMKVRELGEFKAVSEQAKSGIMHGWLDGAIDEMLKEQG